MRRPVQIIDRGCDKLTASATFHRLRGVGLLDEHTLDGRRVLTCAVCLQEWRRPRHAGRTATIAPRDEAVAHLVTAHEPVLLQRLPAVVVCA